MAPSCRATSTIARSSSWREDAVIDRALDDENALQFPRVGHRGEADVGALAALEHLWQPHLQPAMRREAGLDDGAGLQLAQRHRRPVDLWVADPRPKGAIGQQPGLGRGQAQRRAKSLGRLQDQLVQRHRPRHPRGQRPCEIGRCPGIAPRDPIDPVAKAVVEHDDQGHRDRDRQQRGAGEASLRPTRHASEHEDHRAERDAHHEHHHEEPQQEAHDTAGQDVRHRHSAFRTAAGFTRRATSPGPSETSNAATSVMGITRIEYGDSTGSLITPRR